MPQESNNSNFGSSGMDTFSKENTFSSKRKEEPDMPEPEKAEGDKLPNTKEIGEIDYPDAPYPFFEHQKAGIEFMLSRKSNTAILADQMGLGKTWQAIVTAQLQTESGIVVLCPASIKKNWEKEINMLYPETDIFIVGPGMSDNDIPSGKDWYIINYDLVDKHKMRFIGLSDHRKIDTALIDEAHYIKGKSQRARATLEITDTLKYVYAITGTPMPNRPIELYNILKAVKHPLGLGSRKKYATRYCDGKLVKLPNGRRFFDDKGSSNLDELREHLEGWMIRRKKEDNVDLPDKVVTILDCEMTRTQMAKYEMAWDDYIHWVKENAPEKDLGNLLMAQQIVELQKLKQVCSLAKVSRIASDIRTAIEKDEKIIVFSQYKETVAKLREKLDKKPKVKYVTLTGDDDQDERQEAIDSFQEDDEVKVFIGNLEAAGVGITLTEASIIMFADMDWSPENHSQAEDRAHRIGQESMVNIYYYVATGTIEEDIVETLDEKRQVIEEVLEGESKEVKGVSMADKLTRRMHGKLSTLNS